MKLKRGVNVAGVQPEMLLAILVSEPILNKYKQECVITSCKDGKHSRGSLHYSGNALDFRTWTLQSPEQCVKEMSEALGEDYDVVLESDHIHVEFQPKG